MKRILSCLLVVLFLFSLTACSKASPEEFTSVGMTITLTSDFELTEVEGYTACYDSKDVAVFVLKESFLLQEGFGDLSLDDYADLVYTANASKNPTAVAKEGDLTVMEYEFLNEQENKTYSYYTVMYKSSDAFWTVQFACKKKLYKAKKDTFIEWANTVEFAS